MLNLVLYSDQIFPACSAIDLRLAEMIEAHGVGTRIAYVASGPEPDHSFFLAGRAYYRRLGLDLALFFDLDEPHSADDIAALFASDAIHLSGGHTGGFLERLKRSGMLGQLSDWARSGGILIGVSAGAILMAPTIATDALFIGERPEDIEDGDALALVPFEFFPHLGDDDSYLPALLRYSLSTLRPIVACNDGEGIVVSDGRIECFGDPLWISGGAVRASAELRLEGLTLEQMP
ncbi:Type 1 glutamine amidotransferase-like domain-containing protein [Ensifer sp. 2YAB10]|jgi:dipeptidase E|uniref:Type 1 glutamine amidotransferase-like domain-containing protein n=1 Tax=unclassified Ensifer TaxID=2633371 RepID=UPI001A3F9FC5|nr:Type 1 glutamine amidotransferase-like domain-containing protein [Ensifer sp. SSB1]MBK5570864.1 Type 1 glutamine amidotransferase-like domain-containing protein [Ensifer sp. SSB1]